MLRGPKQQGSLPLPEVSAGVCLQIDGNRFQGTELNVGNNNVSIGIVHGNVHLAPSIHPKSVRIPLANWLSSLDFGRQQVEALERRTEGTFNWLLETPEFTTWTKDENGGILLCIGKPGAGKTTFASFVINHLQQQRDADSQSVAAVCYVYCRYNTTFTLLQLLELILKQLVLQCPSADIDRLQKLKDEGRRPTIDELVSILQANFSQLSNVFIVIDAVDECFTEDVRHRLFSTLQSWNSAKVLITSRLIPTVQSALPGATILMICPNQADIGAHIRARAEHHPNLTILYPKVSSTDLETKVVEQADGMFLLVELHIQHLSEQTNTRAFLNALEALPNEASATYARALERICQQNSKVKRLALYALSWIFHAQRPLRMIELQYGISSTRSGCAIDESDLDDEALIISSCAGLLVVNQDTKAVSFIHYTVREYIERTQGDFLSEVEIIKCCLRTISLNPPSHPLIEYTASYWGSLVQNAKYDDTVMTYALLSLENPAQFATIWAATSNLDELQLPKDTSASDTHDPHPLHIAATFGLDKIAQILLEKYPHSTGQKDTYGRTPLHFSAQGGHAAVVKMLLDVHVDVDPTDSLHRTPLMLAAVCGHSHVASILLRTGQVDVNATDLQYGSTPMRWAAMNGHLELVQLLIDTGKVDVNAPGKNGRSPLSAASVNGYAAMVQLLLSTSKAQVDRKDNEGWTAFSLAAVYGYSDVVKLLLGADGVDVNVTDAAYWGTPLFWAARCGHLEVVMLLCDNPNVALNASSKFGETAVWIASRLGHVEVVKFLLTISKVDTSAADEAGSTPFWAAAATGHLEVVKLLAEKAEHDVDRPDQSGDTPLAVAASNGHLRVVQFLLDTQRVNANAINEYRETPLWVAAAKGHLEVVKLLVDKAEHDIDRPDIFGTTPLAAAVKNGHFAVTEFLVNTGQVDLNATDKNNETIFSLAASNGGSPAIVHFLLQTRKVNVNAKDSKHGATALLFAADWCRLEVIKLLLDLPDIDIHARSRKGLTAVFYAAEGWKGNPIAVLDLLLNDPRIADHLLLHHLRPIKRTKPQPDVPNQREATPSSIQRDDSSSDPICCPEPTDNVQSEEHAPPSTPPVARSDDADSQCSSLPPEITERQNVSLTQNQTGFLIGSMSIFALVLALRLTRQSR